MYSASRLVVCAFIVIASTIVLIRGLSPSVHLLAHTPEEDLLSSSEVSGPQNDLQQHLKEDLPGKRKTTLPVTSTWNFYGSVYTINVTVGTPPQTFLLAIDISDSFPLLIPSVTMNPMWCEDRCSNLYKSSDSSTYEPDGQYMGAGSGITHHTGYASRDNTSIGDIEVGQLRFVEWTRESDGIGSWELGYDGVLGLAPPWQDSRDDEREHEVITQLLIDHDRLEFSAYSIKLPTQRDPTGEFTLGGINPQHYEDEPTKLEVTLENDNQARGKWTVRASSITFGTTNPLHLKLPNGSYAAIDIAVPAIVLPDAMAAEVREALGATGPWEQVPCERRKDLPDITITLSGYNFIVTPFDYILEGDMPEIENYCIFTIWSHTENGGTDYENFVLLGSPFTRAFYSTFDWGRREISLAKLKT